MNFKARVFGLLLFVCFLAKQIPRKEPRGWNYTDKPEEIRLAITENMSIPLYGSISSQIQYIPQNVGECKFTENRAQYVQTHSEPFDRPPNSLITSMLILKNHQLVMTIDQFAMLSVFSLGHDFLKHKLAPRKIINENSTLYTQNPRLVASGDENVVYIISPFGYSYFYVDSLSTEIHEVTQKSFSRQIHSALSYKKNLYVAAGSGGLDIFSIMDNHDLKKVHNIFQSNCTDLDIDEENKLLYALDFRGGIYVYNISNPDKPVLYDHLQIQTYFNNSIEMHVAGKTILVLFYERTRTVLAEFSYHRALKEWTFVRYFKFKADIYQIHLVQGYFVAIGQEFLGVFPVGLHPKLIKQELNGYVTMSPIIIGQIYDGMQLIGVGPHEIMLGNMVLSQRENIMCSLEANSKLEKIIYRANLSTCNLYNQTRQYYDYCQYTKEFKIAKMEIVTAAPVFYIVWGALILFISLVVLGLCFLIIMRRKKVSKIRKMELEFEQKLKNIALPSARMTDRVGDART